MDTVHWTIGASQSSLLKFWPTFVCASWSTFVKMPVIQDPAWVMSWKYKSQHVPAFETQLVPSIESQLVPAFESQLVPSINWLLHNLMHPIYHLFCAAFACMHGKLRSRCLRSNWDRFAPLFICQQDTQALCTWTSCKWLEEETNLENFIS